MNTNRPTFWNHAPAPATRLGDVGRVHGDNLNTGTFRLVFKPLPEQSKPSLVQGQRLVSVHETEGKIFNSNDQNSPLHPTHAVIVKAPGLLAILYLSSKLAEELGCPIRTLYDWLKASQNGPPKQVAPG
jgi:hypothetical protein